MRRPVTIYRGLLVGVLSTVLVLAGGILLLQTLVVRRTVRSLTGSLIEQTTDEVEARLRHFFDPAMRGISIARTSGSRGLLDLDRPDQLTSIFVPFMEKSAQITSLMLADDRGGEYMMLRLPERWRNRQTRPEIWGKKSLWREWTDIDAAPVERFEEVDYDPRRRPWYQGAVAKKTPGAHWTEPYRFFTTKDPGITASNTFVREGRRFVLGFDIMLKDISRLVEQLGPRSGSVFVLTGDGRVLALPNARKEDLLKRPEELDSPLLADATSSIRDLEHDRFESEGEDWWGAIRPFRLSDKREFRIAVLVPERAFLGELLAMRTWGLAIAVAVLLVAVYGATVLARRYSRPIEALVRESDRISQGDLEGRAPVATHVKELRTLARAHDRMRVALQTLMKLERDLQLARQIQQSTFPDRLPTLGGFQLEAFSEPAEETGGDTYDLVGLKGTGTAMVLREDADRALLLLADATGHGIGPALSVTQVRAMLRMAVRSGVDLATIARQMNEQLCADLTEGRFITTWLGELNGADRTLVSFSAGQGPLLHFDARRGEVESLGVNGPPFGVIENFEYEVPDPIPMRPGDMFAVFSDGIYEAKSPAGELFGEERVRDLVVSHRKDTPKEIVARLRAEVDAFTHGAPPDDDRTGILIKRG